MKKLLLGIALVAVGWVAGVCFQQDVSLQYLCHNEGPGGLHHRSLTVHTQPRYVSPTIDLFHTGQ